VENYVTGRMFSFYVLNMRSCSRQEMQQLTIAVI